MEVYARLACFLVVLLLCADAADAQQSWLVPPPDAKIVKDVQYTKVGGESLLMDLIVPRQPIGKKPVVVWIHGGGWREGDKSVNIAAWLAGKGYVVASIDYRLTGIAPFPAQIWDCKAAIRFLRANAGEYDVDGNIGVWGMSAGGHLAALLGTSGGVEALEGGEGNLSYSSRVQAVVDFFGPTDFTVGALIGNDPSIVAGLLGGKPETAKVASPVTYVGSRDAPTLIVHGDKDTPVPLSQSESFYKDLRRAGVDAKLVIVKNAGHGFGSDPKMKPSLDEIAKTVQKFLDKHLK
jgi:acetyl esterase/lipase